MAKATGARQCRASVLGMSPVGVQRGLAPIVAALAMALLGTASCAKAAPTSTATVATIGEVQTSTSVAGVGRAQPAGTPRFLAATALVPQVVARSEPSLAGPELVALANPLPSGAPLTFLVVGQVPGWYQVQLPVRPNGSTGWLRAGDVTTVGLSYRVEVELGRKQVTVFDGDDVVLRAPVAVGVEPTPTPGGTFYLLELIETPDPDGAYGPLAFGLSGFSETLTAFAGGPGQLGLHGTNDPASLGTNVSKGCIRVSNDTIIELAELLPLGTPVTIH